MLYLQIVTVVCPSGNKGDVITARQPFAPITSAPVVCALMRRIFTLSIAAEASAMDFCSAFKRDVLEIASVVLMLIK